MWELLNQPVVQAALGVGVVLVAVYGGIVFLGRLRDSTHTADTNVDDLAQNFHEMQLEGDISEAELRRIKTVLGQDQVDGSQND